MPDEILAKIESELGSRNFTGHGDSPQRLWASLIHGDNLEVLQALRQALSSAVQCVYLDPPYNNGENFTHYGDSLGHEVWLSTIQERLPLIRECLAPTGSLWISIDDREMHYLKVAADKAFGRENFIATIVWQHRSSRENRRVFSFNHEYLLVYAKDAPAFKATRNGLPASSELVARYRNPDNDPLGPWQSVSVNVQAGHGTRAQFYDLRTPDGRKLPPPIGRCWSYSEAKMNELIREGRVYFGRNGKGVPRLKKYLSESKLTLTPPTLWVDGHAGTTAEAKRESLRLFGSLLFDTPKPEKLLERILHIATNEGDLVLDPYLGSGTTAAVARRMGRRSIGIESGNHILTHALHRLHMQESPSPSSLHWFAKNRTAESGPYNTGKFECSPCDSSLFDLSLQ